MKLLLVFLAVAVNSVSVYTETCETVQNCTVTGCNTGGNLVCDFDGQCTCETFHKCTDGENVGIQCFSARSCRGWYDSSTEHKCDCANTHSLHCVDGICKCGYPSS
ncbi:uncharacterized protein LOC121390009 [Gigantopelta aegis]|uniref:uncharacterized protein LOC121390009 n=1 Tax=Gigantopelta aegis TaxID=1735272 RepID=UPI001B887A66|nr:uncharacterized protein LOC121390009 [Gigantopelta aegis]